MKRVRSIALDNSQQPGLLFRPFTTPASQPDPRGYQVVPRSKPAEVAARPASDEDVAFASVRQLRALLAGERFRPSNSQNSISSGSAATIRCLSTSST